MGKKIVAINECDFGSTGKIAAEILNYAGLLGYETFFATFRSNNNYKNEYLISGGKINNFANRILCRIDGSDGFHNKKATRLLVKWIDKIKPNVISLHNVHGRYINIAILFEYCKEKSIPIIWTLHDCWSFTGRCAHFEASNCEKWRENCGKCPSRKEYPASYLFDGSKKYLLKKTKLFNEMGKLLTLVCPSQWLYNYVKESKIKNCDVLVINNGVPSHEPVSNNLKKEFIGKYNLYGKKILFFASSGYTKRKGVEFFNKLADELDNSKYAFIVAGIKESKLLSNKIINLGYIKREEMDLVFSISDVFVNPTLEDNFPTVNLESLSNGTPIITFNTGGSPETIDFKTGIVIEKGNYKELKKAVIDFNKNDFKSKNCILRSAQFSSTKMVDSYFKLIETKVQNHL